MSRSSINRHPLSRRQVLKGSAALGLGSAAAMGLSPAWATPWGRSSVYSKGVEEGPEIALAIRRESLPVDGKTASAFSINGTSPGPLLRLKEGQDAVLRVTNLLDEPTSIHWHGLILPPGMDGVPGSALPALRRVKPLPIAFRCSRTAPTGTTATQACRSSWAMWGR